METQRHALLDSHKEAKIAFSRDYILSDFDHGCMQYDPLNPYKNVNIYDIFEMHEKLLKRKCLFCEAVWLMM